MSQYQLPPGFAGTGDPVSGNPFRSHNSRHKVWADATAEAEEEVARVKAAFLSLAAQGAVNPDSGLQLLFAQLDLETALFDTWALRGIKVIWSDGEMRAYDAWLVSFANACIDDFKKLHEHAPYFMPIDSLLIRLQVSLGARVQHWKAEACHQRAEQEPHRAERQHTFKPPSKVSSDVIATRKRLVKEFRRLHDLTMVELARRARMSDSTLRNIMAEAKVRGFHDETRDRLLKTLVLSVETWYGAESPG